MPNTPIVIYLDAGHGEFPNDSDHTIYPKKEQNKDRKNNFRDLPDSVKVGEKFHDTGAQAIAIDKTRIDEDKTRIDEDKLVVQIQARLQKKLKAAGFTVILTHDELKYPLENQFADRRFNAAEQTPENAHIVGMLSLHCDDNIYQRKHPDLPILDAYYSRFEAAGSPSFTFAQHFLGDAQHALPHGALPVRSNKTLANHPSQAKYRKQFAKYFTKSLEKLFDYPITLIEMGNMAQVSEKNQTPMLTNWLKKQGLSHDDLTTSLAEELNRITSEAGQEAIANYLCEKCISYYQQQREKNPELPELVPQEQRELRTLVEFVKTLPTSKDGNLNPLPRPMSLPDTLKKANQR